LDDALPLQEEDGTETVLEPLVAESPSSVFERTSEPRGEDCSSPRGVTAGLSKEQQAQKNYYDSLDESIKQSLDDSIKQFQSPEDDFESAVANSFDKAVIDNGQQEIDDDNGRQGADMEQSVDSNERIRLEEERFRLEEELEYLNSTIATDHYLISILNQRVGDHESRRDWICRHLE
jgi:hypothetical protein